MKVNVFLFDDFNCLDAFGPAEVFGKLPEHFYVNYYSLKGDIVTSLQGVKVWTDYLTEEITGDVLIIPGGKGARRFIRQDERLLKILKKVAEESSFCVMTGSGSSLLAQTGVLFRRRICDYPMDENWNRMSTAGIYRQPEAKWIADGKFYSAVSPFDGIDMCLNILADLIDLSVAEKVAAELGYEWNPDKEDGIYR